MYRIEYSEMMTIKSIYAKRKEQEKIIKIARLTNEEREWFDPELSK